MKTRSLFKRLKFIARSLLGQRESADARAERGMNPGQPVMERTFKEIFDSRKWRGKASVSGRGSDDDQTARLVTELPTVLREYGIASMLDIPCGDFHWMRKVNLDGIKYIGADVVRELVERNRSQAGRSENLSFVCLDITADPLPPVDLILCRDCIVHFSFHDIARALENITKSGAKYLLTTTFPAKGSNRDITTGKWRPLNLQLAPFNFPPPLRLIDEGCTLGNGAHRDKSLGLWRIEDLKPVLDKIILTAGA